MNLRFGRIRAAAAAVLAAGALVAASSARADFFDWSRAGASIGGRGTYYWPKGSSMNNGTWMGGAQLRFYGQYLGLELSSDYRRLTAPSGDRVNVFPTHGDLLIYLLPWQISPYLIGGASYVVSDGSGQSAFGPEAGGGVQIWFNPVFSINGDYRYFWKTNGSGSNIIWGSGQYIMLGANLHFGSGSR